MNTNLSQMFLVVLASVIGVANTWSAEADSATRSKGITTEHKVVSEVDVAIPDALLEPSIPEHSKASLLLNSESERGDAQEWGALLSEILESSDQKILQAAALLKIRDLIEWSGAGPTLAKFALDKEKPIRTRMIAVEGMNRHSGHTIEEALIMIAKNRTEPQGLRIAALRSLQNVNGKLKAKTIENISQGEPHLISVLRHRRVTSQRTTSTPQMSEEEEQATRDALNNSEGDETAFRLIQALASGSQKDTVTMLISRYPSEETKKNKAEIALTVTKIAKRNSNMLPPVKGFLTASMKSEKSSVLRNALQKLLFYLAEE